jgi:hypothetical protein
VLDAASSEFYDAKLDTYVFKKSDGSKKYMIELILPFGCDFCDPWGNRIQVVDLHDESLVWLLPYREVQKAGVSFRSR